MKLLNRFQPFETVKTVQKVFETILQKVKNDVLESHVLYH